MTLWEYATTAQLPLAEMNIMGAAGWENYAVEVRAEPGVWPRSRQDVRLYWRREREAPQMAREAVLPAARRK